MESVQISQKSQRASAAARKTAFNIMETGGKQARRPSIQAAPVTPKVPHYPQSKNPITITYLSGEGMNLKFPIY